MKPRTRSPVALPCNSMASKNESRGPSPAESDSVAELSHGRLEVGVDGGRTAGGEGRAIEEASFVELLEQASELFGEEHAAEAHHEAGLDIGGRVAAVHQGKNEEHGRRDGEDAGGEAGRVAEHDAVAVLRGRRSSGRSSVDREPDRKKSPPTTASERIGLPDDGDEPCGSVR